MSYYRSTMRVFLQAARDSGMNEVDAENWAVMEMDELEADRLKAESKRADLVQKGVIT